MASKRVFWNKFGKYFSALVIGAFFLPFFGVSCEGMDVVTVSGADMVGGCKPGGLIAEAEKEEGRQRKRHNVDDDDSMGGGSGMDIKLENVEREPIAIVALVLIVAGFGASFVRSRQGLMASLGLSIATLGVLVALWIKIGGELREAVDKETKLGKSEMSKDVKVDAGGRYGLWVSGLLLITIAALSGRALREPESAAFAPPPGPPPPGPAA